MTVSTTPRVVEEVGSALRGLLAAGPRTLLLGEDILDPYGGAFKVTRGLSTAFPDQVIGTPVSENGIVGVACGLALCGDRVIVEIMFGDFLALAFDPLLNFAAKSVSMYGREQPMRILVRCPVGGRRGYGPTHSQSPQKHFIGIPDLTLHELTPFHDTGRVLESILDSGRPAIFFEDKTLYTRRIHRGGVVDDLFGFDFLGEGPAAPARIFIEGSDDPGPVVIAPGGLTDRVLEAARELFLEEEISAQLIVPSQLYPFDTAPLAGPLSRAERVVIVEDGTEGGTWGAEVARLVYDRLWGSLSGPIALVSAADRVIPSAPHLEREVLVQTAAIKEAIRG